jgi:hypothetical protein
MPGYWVKVGRQVHHLAATTEAAAVREGQAIANLVGAAVTLGHGAVTKRKPMKRNPAPAAGGRTRSSTATEVRSPTRTSTVADTRGNVTVTGGAGAGANTTVNLGARGKPAKRRKTYDRNPLMQGQDFSGESWVIKGIAPNGRKAMAYAGTRAEAENEADYWHANYGIRAITVRRIAAPYRKGRK